MNNLDHISESLETIFRVNILKFFDADPGWKKFGSGMFYPGSATLAAIGCHHAHVYLHYVRHVTGNDQDYLRKIPRVVVQKSALL